MAHPGYHVHLDSKTNKHKKVCFSVLLLSLSLSSSYLILSFSTSKIHKWIKERSRSSEWRVNNQLSLLSVLVIAWGYHVLKMHKAIEAPTQVPAHGGHLNRRHRSYGIQYLLLMWCCSCVRYHHWGSWGKGACQPEHSQKIGSGSVLTGVQTWLLK